MLRFWYGSGSPFAWRVQLALEEKGLTLLTRADLTWLPFVELVARAGIAIEAADLPWVGRWLAAMRTRPSSERSYPPHWRKS